MGIPERDPHLHVVEQVGDGAGAIDRPQRYTRSAQLGNPPGYGAESGSGAEFNGGGSSHGAGTAGAWQEPGWAAADNPFTREFPQPHYMQPQQMQSQHVQPQAYQGQPYQVEQPQQFHEQPRPQRKPGYSDWEVCLRFPFGRLRFGGFIGWERD